MTTTNTPNPLFAGLNAAPIFERGNPFPAGTFDVQVARILAKNTRKGPMLIAECTVLNAYGHPAVKAGEKRSWTQKLVAPDIALPAIKEFLVAVLGYDYRTQKAEVDKKVSPNLEAILSEATTHLTADGKPSAGLDGAKVHLTTYQKETKASTQQAPKMFTVHQWTPFVGA